MAVNLTVLSEQYSLDTLHPTRIECRPSLSDLSKIILPKRPHREASPRVLTAIPAHKMESLGRGTTFPSEVINFMLNEKQILFVSIL